jgi:hypothetical protein
MERPLGRIPETDVKKWSENATIFDCIYFKLTKRIK